MAFLIGLAVVAAFVLPIALTPSMRTRLCTALGQRFDSDVAIASLQVSLLPVCASRVKASWLAITVEATFRHSSASRHFRRRQTRSA